MLSGPPIDAIIDRSGAVVVAVVRQQIEPLLLESVYSTYFADEARFPQGSVEFDSAFLMRNIPHEWQSVPDLHAKAC